MVDHSNLEDVLLHLYACAAYSLWGFYYSRNTTLYSNTVQRIAKLKRTTTMKDALSWCCIGTRQLQIAAGICAA